MSKNKLKVGDWVLFKAETGKIWKVCEILQNSMPSYSYALGQLSNIKAKNSQFRYFDSDTIIPIPKNTNISTMKISSLVALYGNKDMNTEGMRFFEPSKQYNIQINSKNKAYIDRIINIIKKEQDMSLDKIPTSNSNLNAKYELGDK